MPVMPPPLAAAARYTVIRGRRVPLTARGVLPAFHCHFCGRRHSGAEAVTCFREQLALAPA